MADDPSQDIQDIEDSGGQPAAAPQAAPSMSGTAPAPSARNQPMEMPPGLGNVFSTLGAGLGAGGGTPQPMGAQISQQHGGLLTGLAGVLVDGLYAGMAPTRQAAFEAPMRLEQMKMQKQEMALKEQQMQEEMQEAPLREKAMQAQTMINMLHAWGMAKDLNTDYQMQQMGTLRKATDSAIEDGRASVVGHADTLNDVQTAVKNWRAQHPDSALQVSWVPEKTDAEGNIQGYQVVQFNPKGTLSKDEHYHLAGYDDDQLGIHIPPKDLSYPAGANQAESFADLSHNQAEQTGAIAVAKENAQRSEQAKRDARADEAAARQERTQERMESAQQFREGMEQKREARAERKEDTTDWAPGVTSDDKKKTHLAENLAYNADAVGRLLMKHQKPDGSNDLVGAVAGRFTSAQQMIGNNNPDISALGQEIHNIALANNGIHGVRSQRSMTETEENILNHFKNGPRAISSALKASVDSVQTFIDDSRPPTYRTHTQMGGAGKGMFRAPAPPPPDVQVDQP